MVTLMEELNRLDRPVEGSTYSNEKVAQLHRDGQLSRSEAEVLDIISYTGFAQRQEDDTDLAEMNGTEEQWEPSCVAIVHEGVIIPIVSLEEIIQWPGTPVEKWMICKQTASILYDILLILLKDEEGGKA